MDVAYFWIIFGALIGWIASVLQDKTDAKSIIIHMFIGIAGGLVGGRISYLLSTGAQDFDTGTTSIFAAVVCATLVVAIMGRLSSHNSDDRS
ncbi:MAG TPA: GlsB/YeaQ/YmgE family stress response membrane protein [Candidatus Saccharimonadales bacterium]|nr:GlsB/YeaQ/YmgE family stress response membrane protein [Candidatus Saccharimonadales bacterium]